MEIKRTHRQVVTSFLVHKGKVLLLHRSVKVSTFPGRLAGVSGSIPPGVKPLVQALQEIQEAMGISEEPLQLLPAGEPLSIEDKSGQQWLVHPFLFRMADPEHIRLAWEHTEARWVDPEAITAFQTVPGLWETWQRVQKR